MSVLADGLVAVSAERLLKLCAIEEAAETLEAEFASCGWCGEVRASHPTATCGGAGLDGWTRPRWANDAELMFLNRMAILRSALIDFAGYEKRQQGE